MTNLIEKMLRTDTRGVRAFLGVLDVLWGIWLLLPMDTFSVSRSYDILEFWAPEFVWGLLILFLGIFVLYHMRKGVYWSKVALISLFANILFWGSIVTAIIIVSPASTGVLVYSLVFLTSVGLYVKGQVYRQHHPEVA